MNTHAALQAHTSIDAESILRQHPYFSELSPQTFEQFTQAVHVKQAAKGTVLYLQEDEAKHFYLIHQGWVKLFRETLDGDEAVIDVLNDGHVFGDTAIFDENEYSTGAQVVENTTLITLPLALLKTEITNNPAFAMKIFSLMSRYRREQNREIEHRDLQSAPQRIGCFLLRLCKQNQQGKVTLHLPYDKSLIASRLGMKPETFSRALSRLKQEVNMKIQGATVEFPSVEDLVEYTCSACSSSFPCEDLEK